MNNAKLDDKLDNVFNSLKNKIENEPIPVRLNEKIVDICEYAQKHKSTFEFRLSLIPSMAIITVCAVLFFVLGVNYYQNNLNRRQLVRSVEISSFVDDCIVNVKESKKQNILEEKSNDMLENINL